MSKVLEIMAFSNWIDIFNKITSIKKCQVLYLFHFKCFEQNNKKKIQFRIFNHSVVYRQSKNCIKVQLIYSERPRWTHFLRLNALLYLGFLLLLLQRIYLLSTKPTVFGYTSCISNDPWSTHYTFQEYLENFAFTDLQSSKCKCILCKHN